jgi:hypothetical protein
MRTPSVTFHGGECTSVCALPLWSVPVQDLCNSNCIRFHYPISEVFIDLVAKVGSGNTVEVGHKSTKN